MTQDNKTFSARNDGTNVTYFAALHKPSVSCTKIPDKANSNAENLPLMPPNLSTHYITMQEQRDTPS